MSVHVRPCLPADREYISANAATRHVYERNSFQPELVKYVKVMRQTSKANDLNVGRLAH